MLTNMFFHFFPYLLLGLVTKYRLSYNVFTPIFNGGCVSMPWFILQVRNTQSAIDRKPLSELEVTLALLVDHDLKSFVEQTFL